MVAGNKASVGRPAGSSAIERFRRAITDEDKQEIINTLVKSAKGSEIPSSSVKAAEVLLARLVPAARPQSERVVVPGMRDAATLADKVAAVLTAIADGEISADAGRSVLSALADAARILQVSDLEERMRKLEGKRGRTIDAKPEPSGELV
jgi:hypothetical protein